MSRQSSATDPHGFTQWLTGRSKNSSRGIPFPPTSRDRHGLKARANAAIRDWSVMRAVLSTRNFGLKPRRLASVLRESGQHVPMAGGVGYARQSAITPEGLQGLVEDAGLAGSSETRGTEPSDPATKTETIIGNAGTPSES